MDKIAYVYLKGENYKQFKLWYEGDEDFNEIEKTFETFNELIAYACEFSNLYSIPIQFYL